MASRLLSSKTTKLQKLVYRKAKNYVSQRLINSSVAKNGKLVNYNALFDSKIFVVSVARYKARPLNILKKAPAPLIKCPRNILAGRFMTKGCSGLICSVKNPEYESQLIMKQPYCYGTDFPFTESNFLAKLSNGHPNIINYFGQVKTTICSDPAFFKSCPDVLHYGDTTSLVLERMDGNLDELLQSKQVELSAVDRVDILSQILEAQVYMRSRSICHRDLKPANILIKYISNSSSIFKFPVKFSIKVSDFDCSLDLSATTNKEINHQGTPDRTAPEILNCALPITGENIQSIYSKSDIWAIGALAYELFSSSNPFSKIDAATYAVENLPALPEAPNIIEKLVKRLLDPDWALRYQACIASDILQLFRLKSIVKESVFNLFKAMSIDTQVGCCFVHQMYFSGPRFLADRNRLQFAINFIEEDDAIGCLCDEE